MKRSVLLILLLQSFFKFSKCIIDKLSNNVVKWTTFVHTLSALKTSGMMWPNKTRYQSHKEHMFLSKKNDQYIICYFYWSNPIMQHCQQRHNLTALKLWKSPTLCGGVSIWNCKKGFISRWGWMTVGVRRNVGTAPVRLMLPAETRRMKLRKPKCTNSCFKLSKWA